jgi:hydrogenase/urease accessory protein HupE
MAGAIYLLCAATSLACAGLLWRSYHSNGVRLLFWSSLCFFGLAIENTMLYLDQITFPKVDLSLYRHLIGLGAVLSLIYGLIWESK